MIWKKGLRGLTGQQVADGLARCLAQGESWPPSLPEFRAMCLGSSAQHKQNAAAYRAPECLKLTKPRANREQARHYLQAMRKTLSGQGAKPEKADTAKDSSTQAEEMRMPSTEAHALYSDASTAESVHVQPCIKEKPLNYTASEHQEREAQREAIAPTPPARGERSALTASKTWSKPWRISKYARLQEPYSGRKISGKVPPAPPARGQSQAFTAQMPQPP